MSFIFPVLYACLLAHQACGSGVKAIFVCPLKPLTHIPLSLLGLLFLIPALRTNPLFVRKLFLPPLYACIYWHNPVWLAQSVKGHLPINNYQP